MALTAFYNITAMRRYTTVSSMLEQAAVTT
jgi:hypothetical protein